MDIANTIETYGLERLKAVSGIPTRTLYRWAEKGIPGEGAAHEMRLNQLRSAVEKIKAESEAPRKAKPARSKRRGT